MNITSRSYLTAGVAALGAGAIALTPVQPLPNHLALTPQRVVSDLSVDLAAAIDPITPILQLAGASLYDVGVLIDQWSAGLYVNGVIPMPPNTGTGLADNGNLGYRTGGYETGVALPYIRQNIRNGLSYLAQLPDVGAIVSEITGNIRNTIAAPFQAGVDEPGKFSGPLALLGVLNHFNQNVSATPYINLGVLGTLSQRDVGALLPVLLGAVEYTALKPILDLATTPISGVLLGAIGPVLAPVLQLGDSLKAVLADIKGKDITAAINELINIPTKMVGAALVGGPTLDLTKLLGGLLPDSVESIGIKMGGLLSPGGVALDAVAAVADAQIGSLPAVKVTVPGLPVGPVGSVLRLFNFEAQSIRPPLAPAASKRAKAAASEDAPATPKRLSRAGRDAGTPGAASTKRAPRSAAARHAG